MSTVETKISWSVLKDLKLKKRLPFQCADDSSEKYLVTLADGPLRYQSVIFKTTPANADQLDWETNFKDSANTVINHIDFERFLKDSFGRLRVSSPETIFDCAFLEDELGHIISSSVSSGGTASWNSNISSTELSVTTTTNSRSIIQTYRYIPYHPGKSQMVKITGNLKGKVSGVNKYFGQFDANNGVYFCTEGTTACVGLRSKCSGSVVDTHIAQSDWNIDKFDGTGPSGIVLDFTKQLIFVIDYQWQGSGQIRYGFSINEHIFYCHIIHNANIKDVPYMQRATLPLRAELINTTNQSSSMHVTCLVVESEGGWGPEGESRTVNTGSGSGLSLSSTGTRKPLISLRKQTSEYDVCVQIVEAGIFPNSSDVFLLELVINPTLTGASWSNVTGSCQKDTSASSLSGGRVIYSNYVSGSSNGSGSLSLDFSKLANDLYLGSDLSNVSDIFTIAITNLTATAYSHGFVNYKEII